jgi:hypothetical protein
MWMISFLLCSSAITGVSIRCRSRYLICFGLDQYLHEPLQPSDQRQEDHDIESVEQGMGESDVQHDIVRRHVTGNKSFYNPMVVTKIYKNEHIGRSEDVEQRVGPCDPLGIGSGAERGDLGRYRRADVVAEDERYRRGKIDHPPEGEDLDQCDRRAAALQGHRDDRPDEDTEDGIPAEIYHQRLDVLARFQGFERLLHVSDADEEDAESKEHLPPSARGPAAPDDHQEKSDPDGGQGVVRYLENSEEAHDPGREGGADVGSEDYRDGLFQSEESSIDESDDHHCHGAAALDERRDARSDEQGQYPVPGQKGDDVLEALARNLPEPFRHHPNAEEKESEPAEEPKEEYVVQDRSSL